MYDARTKLSGQVVSEVREHFGEKVLRSVIPRTVRLSEAPSFGQPITTLIRRREARWRTATQPRRYTMARRSGLGKGLSSLIPMEGGPRRRDRRRWWRFRRRRSPRIRTSRGTTSMRRRSSSWRRRSRRWGVLQPILVRPLDDDDDQYELIAGERRWRATQRAGLATIPAIVRATSDLSSVEQALVENLHRQDLTALEEAAAAFQQLARRLRAHAR